MTQERVLTLRETIWCERKTVSALYQTPFRLPVIYSGHTVRAEKPQEFRIHGRLGQLINVV